MSVQLITWDEANGLVPFLTETVTRLRLLKIDIEELAEQCLEGGHDPQILFGDAPLEEPLLAMRVRVNALSDEVNDLIHEIESRGGVLKDIDSGLVDFHSQLGEKTVCLCWKLGEKEIAYYHDVDKGFNERKSLLDRDVLSLATRIH